MYKIPGSSLVWHCAMTFVSDQLTHQGLGQTEEWTLYGVFRYQRVITHHSLSELENRRTDPLNQSVWETASNVQNQSTDWFCQIRYQIGNIFLDFDNAIKCDSDFLCIYKYIWTSSLKIVKWSLTESHSFKNCRFKKCLNVPWLLFAIILT